MIRKRLKLVQVRLMPNFQTDSLLRTLRHAHLIINFPALQNRSTTKHKLILLAGLPIIIRLNYFLKRLAGLLGLSLLCFKSTSTKL
jgi:hypothetical protein